MRVEINAPLSLGEISKILGIKNPYRDETVLSAITTDTREVQENDLFIALKGETDSGEKYVNEAIAKGCYVLSSQRKDVLSVADTATALLKIAEHYKKKLCLKHTVAVTGSVGKSTTVKLLHKILSCEYKTHAPLGNFNNEIGVPLTVLATPMDTEILIPELGMNHENEISRLSKCVHPDIAVITNIGTAHVGNLGSRENIARAKLEILDGMSGGVVVLPKDEPLLAKVDGAVYVGRNTSLSPVSLDDMGDTYSLRTPRGVISGITFFDKREHLLRDLLFAATVASIVGMKPDSLVNGIRAINEGDIRQRFIQLDDCTIFDDSYNASLESIVADLKYIKSFGGATGAFLGDVLELGKLSKEIHYTIGLEAARLGIDHLYLYGDYATYTADGARNGGMDTSRIYVNSDISSPGISIEQIKKNHLIGELILFKASHRLRLDKIADAYAADMKGLEK